MELLLGILGLLLLVQFAVIAGPPYVPTLTAQRKQALDMLDLKPRQKFYDLGCGDGGLLKEAAGRGLTAIGYEINPILAAVAWLRTKKHRQNVRINFSNFWRADISAADGVFVFLTSHHMVKLDKFMEMQTTDKPIKLVSYGFAIPGKKPVKTAGALFLYHYD